MQSEGNLVQSGCCTRVCARVDDRPLAFASVLLAASGSAEGPRGWRLLVECRSGTQGQVHSACSSRLLKLQTTTEVWVVCMSVQHT
jgi:hypothetical protein